MIGPRPQAALEWAFGSTTASATTATAAEAARAIPLQMLVQRLRGGERARDQSGDQVNEL